MHASIHAVADMLKMNTGLFQKGLEEVSQDDATRRPDEKANPILWLVGHITGCRIYMLNALGIDREVPWGDLFNAGYDKAKKYPSLAELKSNWNEVSETLLAKLADVGPAELEKPSSGKFPTEDHTARGTLVFWMYHEAWHMGQIAYAKKCLGKQGLVPY